ncbi:MAG TPA: beta-galactosidase, partial [Bacteroidota bacterium]
ADGNSLVFVTVRIVDGNNLTVPTATNLVHFQISGPGVIAATGNGDPTDHRSFHSDQYNAFNGKCLVIIRSEKGRSGQIVLKAQSDGTLAAETAITSE